MRQIILTFLIALSFAVNAASGTTYYVNDTNSNDSWDGLAPVWDGVHGPKRTIQYGIDAASAGDTVIVAEGIYSNWGYFIDFDGKAITVRSNDPNDPAVTKATIIKTPGCYSGFRFHSSEDLNSLLAGFTIIADYDNYGPDYGGGILCENTSSPTIYNCVIKECSAHYGGGGIACLGSSSPCVVNCTITDNDGFNGSAIYCDANSNPQIINCLIKNNYGVGMIHCKNSSPAITNCTITANPDGDGLYCYSNGAICSPTIKNCIFAYNSDTAIAEWGDLADPSVAFCLFYNNANGDWYDYDTTTTLTGALAINALPEANDNIDDDPLLTPNAHLQAASPCIDAGDSSVNSGQLDIDCEPRVVNGLVEIGADEFLDTDSDGLPDWWEQQFYSSNTAAEPDGDEDDDGQTNLAEYALGTNPLGPYYVDVDGEDYWDGLAAVWDGNHGPKATVKAAINAAQSSDTIILAAGTYTGDGNRNLDFNGKTLTVRSVDPNNPKVVQSTILDCQGNGRGFYFHNNEGPNSILAGITITQGCSDSSDYGGGGVLCSSSSPTIRHCIISKCRAEQEYTDNLCGGGIYCYNSQARILYCSITENYAGQDLSSMAPALNGCGGGIYCFDSNTIISHCTIANNKAFGSTIEYGYEGGEDGGAGMGGGLYFENSGPLITNCIIKNNQAIGGSGSDGAGEYGEQINGGEGGDGLGGGIYWDTNCALSLADCLIEDNYVEGGSGGEGAEGDTSSTPGNGGKGGDALGGGIYFDQCSGEFCRCKLINNSGQAGDGGHGGDAMPTGPEPPGPPPGDGGDGGNGCGGGIYCGSGDPNTTIRNCLFNSNTITGGLGGDGGWAESYQGENGQDGITTGGAVHCDNYAWVILSNCTITNNSASAQQNDGKGGGVYCCGAPDWGTWELVITNCVFKNNSEYAVYDDYTSMTWPDISYCLFYNNPDGDYYDADTSSVYPGSVWPNSIVSDPLLTIDNCHLTLNSPCIETGKPLGDYSGQLDIDREVRVVDVNVDIGCDEWLDSDDDGLPDWWEFKFFDSNIAGNPASDNDNDDFNNLTEYYMCTNPLGPYYVDVNGSDDWDGISSCWDGTHGPKATIQAAIGIASDKDEVVVTAGTYTGSGNRDLDFYGKSITLRSTNPVDPDITTNTIIDCQGSSNNKHRGFYFHSGEDANSVLSGFSIVNGYDSQGAGIQCQDSDPTISHCIIHDTGDGSGIYCVNSSLQISDCTISNCADYGIRGTSGSVSHCVISDNGSGGIYCSSAQINNCLITDNSTSNYGGGIHCTGNSTAITNCTITNNSAGSKGGGIYCYYSSPAVKNCIFANNTKHAIYEYPSSSDPAVSYCLFYGNPDGDYYDYDTSSTLTGADAINSLAEASDNIDGNPLFATDGYHLKPFSPCINTGDSNNENYSGQTDINNQTRIRYGRIDIGVDEVFPIAGDFEPDEDVDMSDLGTFTTEWLNSCSEPDWCNNCDIDQSDQVDFADFARFALHWLYGVEE